MLMTNSGLQANGRDPQLIKSVLSKLALFQNVDPARLATIAAHSWIAHARRGALIAEHGAQLPGVIVFVYGSAKLSLPREQGEEKILRFLSRRDSFGESAALHDQPSPVRVVALADSMLVIVPPLPLLQLLEHDSQFARNLVRALADKFLGLLAQLETSLRGSALQRLAAYLDSLAGDSEPENGPAVRLPASKAAIAAHLGITKETMSRLLRELARRRLITVVRREILVHDRAALGCVTR